MCKEQSREIIAERSYWVNQIEGPPFATARLMRPSKREDGLYEVPIEFSEEFEISKMGVGPDAIEALLVALCLLGTFARHLADNLDGELVWSGGRGPALPTYPDFSFSPVKERIERTEIRDGY
jgi:hypothetical protein